MHHSFSKVPMCVCFRGLVIGLGKISSIACWFILPQDGTWLKFNTRGDLSEMNLSQSRSSGAQFHIIKLPCFALTKVVVCKGIVYSTTSVPFTWLLKHLTSQHGYLAIMQPVLWQNCGFLSPGLGYSTSQQHKIHIKISKLKMTQSLLSPCTILKMDDKNRSEV